MNEVGHFQLSYQGLFIAAFIDFINQRAERVRIILAVKPGFYGRTLSEVFSFSSFTD